MSEGATAPRIAAPLKVRLLSLILIILTLLPLVVFATDAPNRAFVRAARQAALARAGVTARDEDPALRLERSRVARASRHPTLGSALIAMLVQLFWVCVVAWVGRRVFSLRL
jgi:hypothetical protein